LENEKSYNKIGQQIKPEEVIYIILGNRKSREQIWGTESAVGKCTLDSCRRWFLLMEGLELWH
jgi:hypothetical protein